MIKQIFKKILPFEIITLLKRIKNYKYSKQISNYYKIYDNSEEIKEVLRFIEEKGIFSYYPYDFTGKYNISKNKVYKIGDSKLKYVIHDGKKLYFKESYKDNYDVAETYTQLLIEQDEKSPHKYKYESAFNPKENSDRDIVFIDLGSAEGIIGLEIIDRISKLIILESQLEWIEALKETFKPWEEKVIIIPKWISEKSNNENITIDEIFMKYIKPYVKVIIKIDIEGMEQKALNGAANTLKRENVIWMVCTYHKKNDYRDFEQIFEEHNFKTEHSDGYMTVIEEGYWEEPYLRRGVIKAFR